MIVAYLPGNTRPLADHARAAGVAIRFRAPSLAGAPVPDATAVYCPGCDEIAARYAAFGVPRITSLPLGDDAPNEWAELPPMPRLLLVFPGPTALDALRTAGIDPLAPGLPAIGVNAATSYIACDYWLALDGQRRYPNVPPVIGKPVWLVADQPKAHALGDFFRVSRLLGETVAGPYTSVTALRLAAAIKPAELLIAGLDLIPGPGIDGAHPNRDAARFASERSQVAPLLAQLAAAGITVRRLQPAPAGDDLTHISGIGEHLRDELAQLGIATYQDLIAAASDEHQRGALVAIRGVSARNLALWARTAAALIDERGS